MTPPNTFTGLRLRSASNFRDLAEATASDPEGAGHPNPEALVQADPAGQGARAGAGPRLKPARLFRSDHLSGLHADDLQQLAAIGLRRSLDFRGAEEQAAAPYDWPGLVRHDLGIEPTVTRALQQRVQQGQRIGVPEVRQLMHELYRWLINDQAPRFAQFFDLLLQDPVPTVFHCTAGKDRTGLAAALLLMSLGVPEAQVRRDYLLTNQRYTHQPPPHPAMDPDAQRVLWRVEAGFLDSALAAIHRDQGGWAHYQRQRLGLSDAALAALRHAYLDSPRT